MSEAHLCMRCDTVVYGDHDCPKAGEGRYLHEELFRPKPAEIVAYDSPLERHQRSLCVRLANAIARIRNRGWIRQQRRWWDEALTMDATLPPGPDTPVILIDDEHPAAVAFERALRKRALAEEKPTEGGEENEARAGRPVLVAEEALDQAAAARVGRAPGTATPAQSADRGVKHGADCELHDCRAPGSECQDSDRDLERPYDF